MYICAGCRGATASWGVDPGLHVRGAATNIITTTSITRNTTSNNDSSSSSTTTTTTITSTTTSTTVIIMLFLFLDYMYEEPPAPERLHIVKYNIV